MGDIVMAIKVGSKVEVTVDKDDAFLSDSDDGKFIGTVLNLLETGLDLCETGLITIETDSNKSMVLITDDILSNVKEL